MAGITTSIVISFQDQAAADAANAILTAEIDSREDGLNEGKSQFTYTDSPAYLVFSTSNVTFEQFQTDGVIAVEAAGTIDVDEVLTFVDSETSSLSKPPNGSVTFVVMGGSGIESVNDLVVSGGTVTNPTKALAVVRATYQTSYKAYRLTGVVKPSSSGGLDEYPVVIYILGAVT